MKCFVLGLMMALVACSSAPKNEFPIRDILSSPIRVRRPVSEPANPWAGPGGEDYQSKVLPNERYDCEEPAVLFQQLDVSKVRACFDSITVPLEWKYRLIRTVQPVLMLVEAESNPSCVKEVLSEIPVPRELFFLSRVETQTESLNETRECWNARIPLEADKVLDVTLPKASFEMTIRFPLKEPIANDTEMRRMLLGWSLTPFFWIRSEDQSGPTLFAQRVTRDVCHKCFDDKLVLEPHPEVAPPKTWPTQH